MSLRNNLASKVLHSTIAGIFALSAQAGLAKSPTESANEFTVRMLKSLSSQKPKENIIFSPSSLSTAFSIVLAGASQNDQAIVLKSLGYEGMSLSDVLQDNKNFEKILSNTADYKITSKNSLYTNAKLDPDYKKTIETNLSAKNDLIDFQKSGASDIINKWAYTATDKKIKEIVKDNEISKLDFLALNATVFDAKWAFAKFDSPRSKTNFYSSTGDVTAQVDLMTSNPRISIAQKAYDKFTVYDVPYALDSQGQPMGSFVIILPQITNQAQIREAMMKGQEAKPLSVSLDEVIASLSSEKLASINNDIKNIRTSGRIGRILLNLPKFTSESTFGDELEKMMKDLGAESIFKRIDMSPMVEVSKKSMWSNSKIALIKQKAVIEVNEEGTKAAAVSAIGGFAESCPPPSVLVNRPFAYLVKDNVSGRVIFAGKFVNPSQK